MRGRVFCLVPLAIIFSVLTVGAQAQFIVGASSIMAPSVNLQNNTGQLTQISLTVTQGGGVVTVTGPAEVANNTRQSAQEAAMYASHYLGKNFSKYNFIYTINDINANVSGPSAGAAMSLLAISAMSKTNLVPDFTITGTIDNGTIGPIGGVYDKSAAAAAQNMRFILVPMVPQGSQENELYYLVQGRFGIPLVEVANISDALQYAYGKKSVAGAQVTLNLSSGLSTNGLPPASIKCSNNCSEEPFAALINYTMNYTSAQLSLVPGTAYPSAVSQMRAALNQSASIASDGYLYLAGDLSFLTYINAFFLSSGNATVGSGQVTLRQVNSYCTGLTPAQLTSQNYEWVIQGELRQSWGSFTSSQALSSYNSSYDSDQVLSAMYSAGESQGWCHAAGYMYGLASLTGGQSVTVSQNLSAIAKSRISRASEFPNDMYITTAENAYSNGNYAMAIVGADYAYASGLAGKAYGLNASELNSMAIALANNSTYGSWATQYANEALFYAYESKAASNASTAHGYAMQAYSAAVLAQQMSNDTMLIHKSLAPGNVTTTVGQAGRGHPINEVQALMYVILAVVVLVLIVDFVILRMISRLTGIGRRSRGFGRATQRRRRR